MNIMFFKKKIHLSSWAQAVSPSSTLAIDAKAKALKAEGEAVCGFGAGELDFDTPDFIKNACKQALDEGKTKYTPTAGILPLRLAIAQKYNTDGRVYGGDVSPRDVIISPGGKFSCYLAIMTTCSPGDEVIVPAPYWVSYPEMIKMVGAIPKMLFAGEDVDFKISPQQLKEAITPKTKLLILNNPSNPTGIVYSQKEIEAIVEIALQAGLYILSDEIYEHMLYDGAKHFSPASISKEAALSTITVSGFSKTFSMTGWRLGTLVASAPIAKAVENLQSHMTSNATTFAQYGALAALQQHEESTLFLKNILRELDARRTKMFAMLSGINGVSVTRSMGAFYLFPKIDVLGLPSSIFAERLLDQEKVAVVPGAAFGADQYIRFSYATSEDIIIEGVKRFERFCTRLMS